VNVASGAIRQITHRKGPDFGPPDESRREAHRLQRLRLDRRHLHHQSPVCDECGWLESAGDRGRTRSYARRCHVGAGQQRGVLLRPERRQERLLFRAAHRQGAEDHQRRPLADPSSIEQHRHRRGDPHHVD
jgi:hypothetical protein